MFSSTTYHHRCPWARLHKDSHLDERARLRLPHERRARIAADHAGGVIAAQRRDRARLGRRLGWLRDLPDARRASASLTGRRRARSAAHRLRARAGRRRAAIAAGIQHFGDQHRPRNRGIWVVSCFFLKGAKRHKKTPPLTATCSPIFFFFVYFALYNSTQNTASVPQERTLLQIVCAPAPVRIRRPSSIKRRPESLESKHRSSKSL